MADEAPSMKREGTMAVTSEEGKAFLESQGFKDVDSDAKTRGQKAQSPPKVARQTTMLATAKEGEKFIGEGDHGRTRAQTRARLSGGGESEENPPSMKRAGTMAATAKEGQAFLEREGGTSETRTRRSTGSSSEQTVEDVEPSENNGTPSMKRTSTMAVTAKEGQAFLESQGGEATNRTRQADSGQTEEEEDAAVGALKRTSTMAATAQEAQELLGASAPEGSTRAESAALQAALGKRSHEEEEGAQAKRSKEDNA